MSTVDEVQAALTAHLSVLHTLGEVRAVLNWDEQTQLPPKGAEARAQQNALMGQLVHERLVDPQVGEWLDALDGAQGLTEAQRAGVRNIRRDYERAVRVPGELVRETALVSSASFAAWVEAREKDDFARFAPHLRRMVELTRERARCIDPHGHPYEVLLEDYDPGLTVATLRETFGRLRDGLGELIGAIQAAEPVPPLAGAWDRERQLGLQREVAAAFGYDLQAGRIDLSAHPFTTTLGAGDVRITTHVFDDDLIHGLTGVMHEAGHAMYEQGLPPELRSIGAGGPASLGMHESQSRFWENYIGRSRAFCSWLNGVVRRHFPDWQYSEDTLFRGANRVEPGLIRVAADEVTYNLHIIVRFELELALLEGDLAVEDLPEAWNARYREYLGIEPPDDARGVLQDVHWSQGAFAYFPSYTLGNLYAASFGAVLEAERPTLWEEVAAGDFSGTLGWLRDRIHRRGHVLEAPDLLREVVGKRDAVEDLLSYLWGRHGALYGVTRP